MGLSAPLVVALGGALTYAFAGNPKLVRIGELAFFVGFLWLVYGLTGTHLRF